MFYVGIYSESFPQVEPNPVIIGGSKYTESTLIEGGVLLMKIHGLKRGW